MTCLICQKEHNNKLYCSRICSEKAKFGRKRPDVAARNKNNNPMKYPDVAARHSAHMKTVKWAPEVIQKRAEGLRKRHKEDPALRVRQTAKMVALNRSKPLGWKRIKKLILQRDNYLCQRCGKDGKRLIVHHKDHRGRNLSYGDMNNNPDNLIVLCSGCHISVHTWHSRRQNQMKVD